MHNESKSRAIKLYAVNVCSLIRSRIWENQENWQISSYYAPVLKSKFNTVRDANRMRYKKEIIIDLAPFSTRQKPPGAEALSEDSHTVFH